jgi:hypothetical protein
MDDETGVSSMIPEHKTKQGMALAMIYKTKKNLDFKSKNTK